MLPSDDITPIKLAIQDSNVGQFSGSQGSPVPADTTGLTNFHGEIKGAGQKMFAEVTAARYWHGLACFFLTIMGAGCQSTIAGSGRFIHPHGLE